LILGGQFFDADPQLGVSTTCVFIWKLPSGARLRMQPNSALSTTLTDPFIMVAPFG
jgi:hypothetical protein